MLILLLTCGEPDADHGAEVTWNVHPTSGTVGHTMSNSSLLNTSLGRLRAVGLAEGVSFLVLLGIAMPLKYLLGMPLAVRIVGMIHGLLFVAFVYLVFEAMGSLRWSFKQVALALLASLLPFGTLLLDRKLRREAAEPSA